MRRQWGAAHWNELCTIVIGILTGTFMGSFIVAQNSIRFLIGF
jgi:uncharacterized membrane protein YfcA